jgi:hypothetical protein
MNRTELVALEVLTAWAALIVLANRPWPLYALVVLAFLSIVPGALVVSALKLPVTGAARWVVIIATSWAIDALVTQAMVYAHVWTPEVGCLVLAALCGVGCAVLHGGLTAKDETSRWT